MFNNSLIFLGVSMTLVKIPDIFENSIVSNFIG